MKFTQETAEIYIPDGMSLDTALSRTTQMGIAAHADDLEIMAVHGILPCYGKKDQWFCGVVVTDGSGSPRAGLYRDFSDEEMRQVRKKEQKKAAQIGDYGSLIMLDLPSRKVKNSNDQSLAEDLHQIFATLKPEILYIHNLADKHDTHVAVALRTIAVIRQLPEAKKPRRLIGCEVWRDLDWLVDEEKVVFDVSEHENLQRSLMGAFDSQICGGKRYDLAAMGRRCANATFFQSHETDRSMRLVFAMDLSPLMHDTQLSPAEYVQQRIERFSTETVDRINRLK